MLEIILLLATCVLVYLLLPQYSHVPAPSQHPETILLKEYTPSELSKFNGIDDPKIYLSASGRVYDVTNGKSFYGPGSMYQNFSGRDASRGLAKNSFDESMLSGIDDKIDTLSDLDDDERESLREWTAFLENKYQFVGTLKNKED